jgi:hypothetical protein
MPVEEADDEVEPIDEDGGDQDDEVVTTR